ncbi:hypothetical protein K9M42_01945 [Patescibacteria group bacterium]|nr:hypothetical protein [Patescibacteria group bacterium]
MFLNKEVFKNYDIRGIYKKELTENEIIMTAKAYYFKLKPKKVVIGYDARISSEEICDLFSKTLKDLGVEVDILGLIPTGMLYGIANLKEYDGGIMITASHNPKEYNGIKMIGVKDNIVISGKEIYDITKQIQKNPNLLLNKNNEGIIKKVDLFDLYIDHCFSKVKEEEIGKINIAIDASSGTFGKMIEKIENKISQVKITKLNFVPDGNFPNHGPNPLEEGSCDLLSKTIIENNLDGGFIFDGDGDRIFLLDEKGEKIEGGLTLLLIAKEILENKKNAGIVYNWAPKAVPELIKKWGGRALRSKVGYINIKNIMLNKNGDMGGEYSCHYCFSENFYSDSGLLALLKILKTISNSDKKISEQIKELGAGFTLQDNIKVDSVVEAILKIKNIYSNNKFDEFDGLTIYSEDFWFGIRGSSTEPLLRIYLEAENKEKAYLKLDEIKNNLK